MPLLADVSVRIGADLTGFNSGVDTAKNKLNEIKGASDNAGGGVKGLLGNMLGIAGGIGIVSAAGAGFGLLSGFIGDSVTQAAQAQQGMAQLAQVVKSTGGVAGITAQHADDLSNSLAGVTTFSDDTVKSTEAMLLTFTNIGAKGGIFDQTTKTALDMSQALGQDTKSSAIQLGKALNDPIKGITALSRVGVTFDNQQKKLIATYVQHGNMAGAQTVILKELQREFGGSAEAAGNTFAGKLAILNNQFDQTKQQIGGAIIPVLSSLMTAAQPVVAIVTTGLVGGFNWLSGALSNAKPYITDVGNVVVSLAGGAQQLWATIQSGSPAFNQIETAIQPTVTAFQGLVKTVGGDVMPIVNTAVGVFRADLAPALAQIAPPAQQIGSALTTYVIPAVVTVAGLLAHLAGGVIQSPLLPILGTLAGLLAGALAKALDGAVWLVSHLVDAIKGAPAFFQTAGNDIQAAFNGVKDTAGKVYDSIKTTTDNVIGGAKKLWDDWNGLIKGVGITLGVIFGPTIVGIGVEAATSGAQMAGQFIASITSAGVEAGTTAGIFLTSTIPAYISMGVEGAKTAVVNTSQLVASFVSSGVQAAKASVIMTAQMVPALLSTAGQMTKTAAITVGQGVASLASFAAKGYAAAGAMIGTVVPAALSTAGSFIAMAVTGIAGAIAGFIAYIPIALSAAAATLAATWPILAVIAAIGLLVVAILWAKSHWELIQAVVTTAVTNIKNAVGSVFSWVGGMFHGLWDMVSGDLSAFFNNLIGFFQSIPQAAANAMSGLGDAIMGVLRGIGSFEANIFHWLSDHAGIFKGAVDSLGKLLHIQGYARGGRFSGNMPFLVGEKGPELIIPHGMSGQVISNDQLGASGAGNIIPFGDYHGHSDNRPTEIHVYVDSWEMAQKIAPHIVDQIRAANGTRAA